MIQSFSFFRVYNAIHIRTSNFHKRLNLTRLTWRVCPLLTVVSCLYLIILKICLTLLPNRLLRRKQASRRRIPFVSDNTDILLDSAAKQVLEEEASIWEENGEMGFLRLDFDPETQVYGTRRTGGRA